MHARWLTALRAEETASSAPHPVSPPAHSVPLAASLPAVMTVTLPTTPSLSLSLNLLNNIANQRTPSFDFYFYRFVNICFSLYTLSFAPPPATASHGCGHFRVIERFLFDGNAAKTRSCGQYLLDNFESIIGNIHLSNALYSTFQLQPQLIAHPRDLNACVECDVQQRQTICETGQHNETSTRTPKRPATDAA